MISRNKFFSCPQTYVVLLLFQQVAYDLQRRQGQKYGLHVFKTLNKFLFFFQHEKDFLIILALKLIYLDWWIPKYVWFLKLYCHWHLIGKISWKIFVEVLTYTLNISVVSACTFFWRIETKLSFSNRSLEDEYLSIYGIQRHLWCSLSELLCLNSSFSISSSFILFPEQFFL